MRALFLGAALHWQLTAAQESLYRPCPILGPWLPRPTVDERTAKRVSDDLRKKFDLYVSNGTGNGEQDYGEITPNTTSFSVVLFSPSYTAGNDASQPFFDYHHNAAAVEPIDMISSTSAYALGELTQLFTVYASLVSGLDARWNDSVLKYLPELQQPTSVFPSTNWTEVTLGSLASYMSGIVRDTAACSVSAPCSKEDLIQALRRSTPMYPPNTTPIVSNAAVELLANVMSNGTNFADLFATKVSHPLTLDATSFLSASTKLSGPSLDLSQRGSPSALSLVSTPRDMAKIGNSILDYTLLSAHQTSKWMTSHQADTSNPANGAGAIWTVYRSSNSNRTRPILPIYTKDGTMGKYASSFGLVPDLNVGYAILAFDHFRDGPDLNAYADVLTGGIETLLLSAVQQAVLSFQGNYTNDQNDSLELSVKVAPGVPGVSVDRLIVDGKDWRAEVATRMAITEARLLDWRIYPTGLREGNREVFQGIFQDKSALVDAGTPTCITWQTAGKLVESGSALDQFIVTTWSNGTLQKVEWPALNKTFLG